MSLNMISHVFLGFVMKSSLLLFWAKWSCHHPFAFLFFLCQTLLVVLRCSQAAVVFVVVYCLWARFLAMISSERIVSDWANQSGWLHTSHRSISLANLMMWFSKWLRSLLQEMEDNSFWVRLWMKSDIFCLKVSAPQGTKDETTQGDAFKQLFSIDIDVLAKVIWWFGDVVFQSPCFGERDAPYSYAVYVSVFSYGWCWGDFPMSHV